MIEVKYKNEIVEITDKYVLVKWEKGYTVFGNTSLPQHELDRYENELGLTREHCISDKIQFAPMYESGGIKSFETPEKAIASLGFRKPVGDDEPKKETRGRKSKKEKGEEKFKNAINMGARVVEKSLSKIAWEMAHDNLEESSVRLDYQAFWALECATDIIAQKSWFPEVLYEKPSIEERERFIHTDDGYVVIISHSDFTDFIDRKNITTKKSIEIFKRLKEISLEIKDVSIKLPTSASESGWLELDSLGGRVCDLGITTEGKYREFRSFRKMRGRGSKNEEPVFVLIFSGIYGKLLVENIMSPKGAQLQDHVLYSLSPEAQEVFQTVRWKNDLILLNTERICRICGWKWPPENAIQLHKTVKRCDKLLFFLYKKGFITEPNIPKKGRSTKTRFWEFYVAKRKAHPSTISIKIPNKLIKSEGNNN